MQVSTDELASLVVSASHGALPGECDAAQRAVIAMRAARVRADLSSVNSRFLTNVVIAYRQYLRPNAVERLSAVHLYGVDSPYANAIPDGSAAIPRVFVFEGMLQNLYYIIALIKAMDRLQALRPSARFEVDGEEIPEALAFSMAGFSILSDAMAVQRFPAAIHDMLGPTAREHLLTAYRLAVLFILLHELGHIDLGHLRTSPVRSERVTRDLAEPQVLSAIQDQELDADAFALAQIEPRYRPELMPSVLFFFTPLTFLEAFSGAWSANHPLAVNRLSILASKSGMPEREQQIVVDWIQSRVESLRQMASLRGAAGGSLRSRIEERMPVRRAYEIVREIKERVARESGELDTPLE